MWMCFWLIVFIVVVVVVNLSPGVDAQHQHFRWNVTRKLEAREKVREMFHHAYDNYMRHAFPADELKPLSCAPRRANEGRGSLDDALGDYAVTLIDAMDTLAIMSEFDAFETAVWNVVEYVRVDRDVEVSVFEATIRALGGLLSSHVWAKRFAPKHFKKPYNDELLKLAIDLGDRLDCFCFCFVKCR
jgi:hypothetical protein